MAEPVPKNFAQRSSPSPVNDGGVPTPKVSCRFEPRWLLWLLPLAWAGFIFWLSDQSYPPNPGPDFPFKPKMAHYLLYLILGGLLALTLARAHRVGGSKAVVLAVILASLYGGSDEIHQIFVPERTPRVLDWVVDTLGAGLGAAVFYVYESHRGPKKNR